MPEENSSDSASKGNDNLIAAVSYLLILSIIILLVKKDSDYVRFHARQGVVLFGAFVILSIIGIPLVFLLPITGLLNLVILVAVIVGFVQALGGKRYKMPVVSNLSEKINI